MIYDIALIVVGFIAGGLLYAKFPTMRGGRNVDKRVSVIIPARNEQENLKGLLEDLAKSAEHIYETICVDDGSEDGTTEVAKNFDVTLVSAGERPEGWTGKSWACKLGAGISSGELLLFLDADVRVTHEGLHKLLSEYVRRDATISVQPYHETKDFFEQFSIIFNGVQTAANGTCFVKSGLNAGLYGPVILISKQAYERVGGHECVKDSVVEDVKLGKALQEESMSYRLYAGDRDISYSMYNSMGELLQGWTKNYAGGALCTHPLIFLCTFLWITSCIATPLFLLRSAIAMDVVLTCVMSVFYIMWVVHLRFVTKHIGRFKPYTCAFFPVFILFFLAVFLISSIKKLFGIPVLWKGRKVKPES